MNRYYSNEVDSNETLPLLPDSSESEAGNLLPLLAWCNHNLPHSIINHCVNKMGRLDVHTLCEQEDSRPTRHNDRGVII